MRAAIASLFASCLLLTALPAVAADGTSLVIGETLTLPSKVLKEERRINVFRPTYYGEHIEGPLPVLYMLDGGINEDFLHIAGLVQISVANGTMRPFLLVGIENTERRRDLTGPTEDPEDLAIAPRVGESARFRDFLARELFAFIEERYDVTGERAIIGESLAGLFVMETLLLAPQMFDTYIAVDPSVWWNRQALVTRARQGFNEIRDRDLTVFIAAGKEASGSRTMQDFVAPLRSLEDGKLAWHYEAMPDETHATIYHPAALKAFRLLFKPEPR